MSAAQPTAEPQAVRWVTAHVLLVMARQGLKAGQEFMASDLDGWLRKRLTADQRVHATSKLCALGFLLHQVRAVGMVRRDCYTVTPEGAAAIEEAAGGKMRRSGPKGSRKPNPVRRDALSTRLWNLLRHRKVVDTDAATRVLCDAGEDFERVRATVARTLRRWELAGAVGAGAQRVRSSADAPQSNGAKRYVLLKDSPEPPAWRQALREQALAAVPTATTSEAA